MNKQTKIIGLLLLIFLSSCSSLIDILEDKDQKYILKPQAASKTYCQKNEKDSFVSESKQVNDAFKNYLLTLKKNHHNLTFIEKAVSLALVEMNSRPHLSSPTSQLQILIQFNGRQKYWDFQLSKNSYEKKGEISPFPYLYGLEVLLKNYPSQKSLYRLAALLDKYLSPSFKVEKSLRNFFLSRLSQLKNNPNFKNYYFRDNDLININENLPTIKFTKIISLYLKKKVFQNKHFITTSNQLFPYGRQDNSSQGKDLKVLCNQDLTLYDNSIYAISPANTLSNNFGLKDEKQNTFLASSSQVLNNFKSLEDTALFSSTEHSHFSTMCFINKTGESSYHMMVTATKDRDTGQHVYHLLKNDIDKITTLNELDFFIKDARYLLLKNPIRIVIESRRMNEERLKKVMKLSSPIYHSQHLAEIWSFIQFNNSFSHFVIDDRYENALYCDEDEKKASK